MEDMKMKRRGFLTLLGATAVAGCTVNVPPPVTGPGPSPTPQPQPQPQPIQPPPAPQPSGPTIRLQNAFYRFVRRGNDIRALARNSGNSITLTSQTGANFTENYRWVSGEQYRAPSGNTITVTSPRSFVWRTSQFGVVNMRD